MLHFVLSRFSVTSLKMTTLSVPKPLPAELFCLMIHFIFMLAPSLYVSFTTFEFPWISVAILVSLPLTFAIDTLICDRKEFTQVKEAKMILMKMMIKIIIKMADRTIMLL